MNYNLTIVAHCFVLNLKMPLEKIDICGLLNELEETTNKIETSVNKLGASSNRLVIEVNKSEANRQIRPEKHGLILQTTQEIMNICSNFKTAHVATNKKTFSDFQCVVEKQTAQIDNEVDRMNAVHDIIEEIKQS